jgi:hypothetical protein
MKGNIPIAAAAAVLLCALGIVVPLVLAPDVGGQLDLKLRYGLPVVGLALLLCAIGRRENRIWTYIAILSVVVYVALHKIRRL